MLAITKDEMMQALKSWFAEEVESCPQNAASFVEWLFDKYQPERSKREDMIDLEKAKPTIMLWDGKNSSQA